MTVVSEVPQQKPGAQARVGVSGLAKHGVVGVHYSSLFYCAAHVSAMVTNSVLCRLPALVCLFRQGSLTW